MPSHFLGSDAVDAALLTAAAVVSSALIGAAIAWAKDLGSASRRARTLDEAAKRVQFWDVWIKTLDSVGNCTEADRYRAEAEIRDVGDMVKGHADNWRTASEYRAYRASVVAWKRFFLVYEPPSRDSRLARMNVYIATIITLLESYALFRWRLFMPHRAQISHPQITANALSIAISASVIVFLVFRLRAALVERRALNRFVALD